ncbi:MAG: hypothetical protein HY912_02900 [Desulfomonile tiedjei]|uniref:Uncharacterized protein n=1 Tax=Desulfomonile tiedjei TaxID=2358 RepID=A0A9D6UXV5_9BACT|nr:hypothetical protein [Desulfomonile tiedjei]
MAISSYTQRFLPGNAQKSTAQSGIYSRRFDASTAPRSTRLGVSRTTFNYTGAFGKDIFKEPSDAISQQIQSLSKSGNNSEYVARPDDTEVTGYMSHVLGGQRELMDEYVKRAATSGTRRGGTNAVGGPAAGSSLHHDAMKTLASDYSNRFSQAMDYGRYAKGTQYGQERDRMKDLQNLFGIQHSYLTSSQSRQDRIAELKHQDWLTMLSKTQSEPQVIQVAQSPESSPQQPSTAQTSGVTDRQRASYEMRWKELLHKMDTVPLHWSRGDQEQMDYLSTQLGYISPLKRSHSVIVK